MALRLQASRRHWRKRKTVQAGAAHVASVVDILPGICNVCEISWNTDLSALAKSY